MIDIHVRLIDLARNVLPKYEPVLYLNTSEIMLMDLSTQKYAPIKMDLRKLKEVENKVIMQWKMSKVNRWK